MNWKSVPAYEGLYEVSDEGQVRSVAGRILKPWITSKGYRVARLSRAGSQRGYKVHRLVAAAFLGASELPVRHVDGDPANNALPNLAYGTPSDNMHDMVSHGRHRNARKRTCHRGHRFDEANTYWRSATQRECRECNRLSKQ